ncbi:MAG: YggS family pyridoxal phosphate-dependent enzyme [Candidatus Bostrichicola ureolyticus]|nr:MAG: YggS family pyridoxal phosphate-dependent enzyme [Candidatus Bostrichicola ureolyticus]
MNVGNLFKIKSNIPSYVKIIAVSKNKPISKIKEIYDAGQRDFGENYINELVEKHKSLPKDIRWHMIGKLQSNKIKYIGNFVYLVHSIEKIKHLKILNKEAIKHNRVIQCLLQIKIAEEKKKSGITYLEAIQILKSDIYLNMKNVKIIGLMGIATFSQNKNKISDEFKYLYQIFNIFKEKNNEFNIISMGMSNDYNIAIKCGSNMIRIGNAIFGFRN